MYSRKVFDFDYACYQNGQKPAKKYFDGLPDEAQDNIKVLLEKLGDEGKLANNRFKKLGGCVIWQLTESTFKIRMLCYQSGRCWFFTNGFPKTSRATPTRFIKLAIDIMKAHIRVMKKMKGKRNV